MESCVASIVTHRVISVLNVMFCAIWYYFYNLRRWKHPWKSVTFSKIAGFCEVCYSNFINNKKKLYGLFSWIGFNCLRAIEPLRGDSLLFTITFQEVSAAQFIDLGRMKGWVELEAIQWIWTRNPWTGNPAS